MKISGGYVVLEAVPFTFENARALLDSTWRTEHPSAMRDYVTETLLGSTVEIAPRFAEVRRTPTAVAVLAPTKPVPLSKGRD